jgi:polar amino acid transport system substrate-binding protein
MRLSPRFVFAALVLALSTLTGGLARAQDGASGADEPFIPHFWDPQSRLERPDVSGLRLIRFVTDDEYPPFGFQGADGALMGFNVDLARAICEELRVPCTIQARRFAGLLPAIEAGEADAAIASIAITPAARARVDFTRPYYRTPARFLARAGETARVDARPEAMVGARVGVVADSAHAAFLGKHFPGVERVPFPSLAALFAALRAGETPLAFADGVAAALWLNGAESRSCCAFAQGYFLEPEFFGDGVGIAVRQRNLALRRALDFALLRLSQQGTYAELYLKHFPIGFF